MAKAERKHLNLAANLGEIVELLPVQVEELTIFLVGAVGLLSSLDELQNERPPGTNLISTGQEVPTDKSLEDTGLATTLAADDGDLREVDGGLSSNLGEDVLKPVD